MPEAAKICVAGFGNILMQDDGVGVHALHEMKSTLPPDVLCCDVGTSILHSFYELEKADKIIAIDAMRAGGDPGTVYQCPLSDLDVAANLLSMHSIGLAEAFRLFAPEKQPEILIIGIEPERVELGLEMSETVRAAIPLVTRRVRQLIECWLSRPALKAEDQDSEAAS